MLSVEQKYDNEVIEVILQIQQEINRNILVMLDVALGGALFDNNAYQKLKQACLISIDMNKDDLIRHLNELKN